MVGLGWLFFSVVSCSNTPKSIVETPLTIRPSQRLTESGKNGAIYQPQQMRMTLFEDRQPRYTGDILTVVLEENLNAQNLAETKITRNDQYKTNTPAVTGPLIPQVLTKVGNIAVNADTETTFDGKGQSNNSNTFTGTITVTVIDVLNNGNLMVAGEKQLALNRTTQFIRFSGVVDPRDIRADNRVSSTKIADARIEQRGNGSVDSAQELGWLGRFFLNILPF